MPYLLSPLYASMSKKWLMDPVYKSWHTRVCIRNEGNCEWVQDGIGDGAR